MEQRFSLEKYRQARKKRLCPGCGRKSFTFYVDNETGEHLSPAVGKCDRLGKCDHHYTPREWFADTGRGEEWQNTKKLLKSPVLNKREPIKFDIVPGDLFEASFNQKSPSDFELFLYRYFDPLAVAAIARKYRLGQSESRNTLFWLLDESERPRSAQEIPYDFKTGRRSGGWHYPNSRQGFTDFERNICFFGQHLLTGSSGKIAIVEAPKTAVVCSLVEDFADLTFLATCAQGNLRKLLDENFHLLRAREIVLFPDLKAETYWRKIARESRLKIVINTHLTNIASDAEKNAGLDIADFILRDRQAELAEWKNQLQTAGEKYRDFLFEVKERESILFSDFPGLPVEKINHLAWSFARHRTLELDAVFNN